MPSSPRVDAGATAADMAPLRGRIAQTCERYGICDFDTINAVLTLKRTATDLENLVSSYCKQVDLSMGRLNVLMVLNSAPEKAMALSDIGDYLVVTRPNITGLIDGLVADGLVKRVHHADDRRMISAQLTEQGQTFMRKFVPFHHRAINRAMSALTRQEKRQIVALLDKLRAHIREVDIPDLEEA